MHGNSSYNPLVSVIIPNYNHAPFLEERIDSVLHQTYKNLEVILLDDASTDNSKTIVEKYRGNEKISHIAYNEVNSGSTFKQWMKGCTLARGEWIWIAESDDVADPQFISKMVLEIEAGVGMLCCQSKVIDAFGNPSSYLGQECYPSHAMMSKDATFNSFDTAFLANEMYRFNHLVNASSVLIKKAVLLQFLPSIQAFKLCGDWMLWVQTIAHYRVKLVKEPLNYFRVHEGTVRQKEHKNLSVFFENAAITHYIYAHFGTKELTSRYSDYLIYIYLNRYPKEVRKGSLLAYLKVLKPFGWYYVLVGWKAKITHD